MPEIKIIGLPGRTSLHATTLHDLCMQLVCVLRQFPFCRPFIRLNHGPNIVWLDTFQQHDNIVFHKTHNEVQVFDCKLQDAPLLVHHEVSDTWLLTTTKPGIEGLTTIQQEISTRINVRDVQVTRQRRHQNASCNDVVMLRSSHPLTTPHTISSNPQNWVIIRKSLQQSTQQLLALQEVVRRCL
ncbi:hypothetical protein OAM67_00435 [bacterium]|nr:hypothetical protein [bacterium]